MTSRKTQGRKCMALWQEIVKRKANYECEVCGKSDGRLNAHHIIGKKNLTLRYDPRNGACLCFTHHTGGNQSAHNDSQWFLGEWMMTNRPDDYNYLWEKKNELSTQMDYSAIIGQLKCPLQRKSTKLAS